MALHAVSSNVHGGIPGQQWAAYSNATLFLKLALLDSVCMVAGNDALFHK